MNTETMRGEIMYFFKGCHDLCKIFNAHWC